MIRFAGIAPLADRLGIAPIAGGSPEASEFTPTAEDWADYRAWSEQLEMRATKARALDALYGYE